MLNDKQRKLSKAQEDLKEVVEQRPTIQLLSDIEFDDNSGFVCDVNTGICGPVTEKKEGEK